MACGHFRSIRHVVAVSLLLAAGLETIQVMSPTALHSTLMDFKALMKHLVKSTPVQAKDRSLDSMILVMH